MVDDDRFRLWDETKLSFGTLLTPTAKRMIRELAEGSRERSISEYLERLIRTEYERHVKQSVTPTPKPNKPKAGKATANQLALPMEETSASPAKGLSSAAVGRIVGKSRKAMSDYAKGTRTAPEEIADKWIFDQEAKLWFPKA